MKRWLTIGAVVVVLAVVGYLIFGDGGLLAGLLGIIGARAKAAGKREQAEEDRVAAQKQRDDVKKKLVEIDAKTEQDVEQIKGEWAKKKGRPPTKREEADLLAKFGKKPPGGAP